MAIHRFLSQQELVNWSDQGKIDVQGTKIVVIGEQLEVPIREAVRFMKLVSGEDVKGLLAKVKTTEQLQEVGAEHYLDSVILGDAAYEVQQGYIADVPNEARSSPAAGSSAAGASPKAPPGADADALARFILNKI